MAYQFKKIDLNEYGEVLAEEVDGNVIKDRTYSFMFFETETVIQDATFENVSFEQCHFVNMRLVRCRFVNCSFEWCGWIGTRMKDTEFEDCVVEGVPLGGVSTCDWFLSLFGEKPHLKLRPKRGVEVSTPPRKVG